MRLFDIGEHTLKNDYDLTAEDFQTPLHICKYMVSLLPKGVKTILEPTPGTGNLVRSMQGFEVTAPDDFFLLPYQKFDAIVMNPPFGYEHCNMKNAPMNFKRARSQAGYLILLECLKMSDTVICLLPWFTLINSNARLRHLQKFGLRSVTQINRNAFKNLRVQCMILELSRHYKGDTVLTLV